MQEQCTNKRADTLLAYDKLSLSQQEKLHRGPDDNGAPTWLTKGGDIPPGWERWFDGRWMSKGGPSVTDWYQVRPGEVHLPPPSRIGKFDSDLDGRIYTTWRSMKDRDDLHRWEKAMLDSPGTERWDRMDQWARRFHRTPDWFPMIVRRRK